MTNQTTSRLRKRIKHPHELTYSELKVFIDDGFIRGNLTEKTDGIAFQAGRTEDGLFYTRTSNSEKVFQEGGYKELHKARCIKNGYPFDPWFSNEMDLIHTKFSKTVGRKLENGKQVSGELFWTSFGNYSKDGLLVRYICIPYSTKIIHQDTFIAHTELSDIIPSTNLYFTVDMDYIREEAADFTYLVDDFQKISYSALNSRKNTSEKEEAIRQLDFIKKEFDYRIRKEIRESAVRPKWGDYTEG